MIEYDGEKWFSLNILFHLEGSIIPKACFRALPSTILAVLIHILLFDPNGDHDSPIGQIWFGFQFALGFLVVFRTQLAYSRYWEGAMLMSRIRGQWFNATSSLFAFCSVDPEKEKDVHRFQQYLVRLLSLLHCSALQQVSAISSESFELLDLTGIDVDDLRFLDSHEEERPLIILQWIQRLIMDENRNKTLDVPPPILSRVFQEFAQGIVNVHDAEKLTTIKFPFPYAQMLAVMLCATSVVTPIIAGLLLEDIGWAIAVTFLSVVALWSINDIAAEIELPFGDDLNDLPLAELQIYMNKLLSILLKKRAQNPPNFKPSDQSDEKVSRFTLHGRALSRTDIGKARVAPLNGQSDNDKADGSTSSRRDDGAVAIMNDNEDT